MDDALGVPPDTFDFEALAPLQNVPVQPDAKVMKFFQQEADGFLDLVAAERLDDVEQHWRETWSQVPANLVPLLDTPASVAHARLSDRETYDKATKQLMPDVFQRLSPQYVKVVRNFAKRLEQWMAEATSALPTEFAAHKVREVAMFGQRLRRYTGLNHLASAARAVLIKPNHIQSMKDDYSRVDFDAVRDQVVWISEDCDPTLINSLEEAFRKFHGSSNSLESWATWLQSVVKRVVGPHEGSTALAARAGSFHLRWCLVSSLVMRDLTLRSADSFGMFHLMRLLCDEYMFFLLEKAVMSGHCPQVVHQPDGGEERRSLEELEAKRSGSAMASSKSR